VRKEEFGQQLKEKNPKDNWAKQNQEHTEKSEGPGSKEPLKRSGPRNNQEKKRKVSSGQGNEKAQGGGN